MFRSKDGQEYAGGVCREWFVAWCQLDIYFLGIVSWHIGLHEKNLD